MKTLLKIALVASVLCSCGSGNDSVKQGQERDSASAALDSALGSSPAGSSSAASADPESEAKRQITENLFASKKEINQLEADLSDSLSRSGLPQARKSLYQKTILQLEASSEVMNKQLEQIMVSDLAANREKLSGIVTKMKGSEKDLQFMIARLDKITRFMETATNLLQTLSPIKPVIAKPAAKPAQ